MTARRLLRLWGRFGPIVLAASVLAACGAPSSTPAPTSGVAPPTAAPPPATQPAVAKPQPAASPSSQPAASVPAPAAAKPTELQTVRLAQGNPVLAYAPVYVARAKGFFEQQGLKLEFTQLETSITIVQALLGGNVDLVASASTDIGVAVEKGLDFLATEGIIKQTLQVCASKSWMESKGITPSTPLDQRMAAFKGAAIGITGPGAASDRVMRWLLTKYGKLDPNKDTEIVNVSGTTPMAGALQQNRIQAYLLSAPTCNVGVQQGYAVVLVKPDEVPEFRDYIHEVLYTRKSWADSHKDLVKRVSTAIAMGNNYILTHPDEAVSILQKDFASVDPKIVEDSVRTTIIPQVPKDGRMSEAMWKATNTVLLEAGLIQAPVDSKEGVVWTNDYIGDASVK